MEPPLTHLLVQLGSPNGTAKSGGFRVRSVPGTPAHYVGRDASGFPCILLGAEGGALRAPIRLAAIEVRFAVPCRITLEERERTETLTVIVCTSPDAQSQRYFLHVCETIIRIVGHSPTLPQVVDAVQHLVDLFRRLSRPSSRSVIGLIGELYLIYRSKSPELAVRAWRNSEDDRFDFAIDDVRLEVKASGDRTRAHSLSLEQCLPPLGTVGVLASLFVEGSGGGLSLMELIREVEHRLLGNEDLILKVQDTVAETLGEMLPSALPMRFDERLARSSLQLYDLSAVPAIRSGIPSEVTQVRFRSDLSRAPAVSPDELAAKSRRVLDLLPAAN